MSAEFSEPAEALLAPLRRLLDGALDRLPSGGSVQVRVDALQGRIWRLHGSTLTLDEALLGPHMHHPREPEGAVRLDRWRRAGSAVLQAAALVAVFGPDADADDWMQRGLALHLADRACPDLQLAVPALLGAARAGGITEPEHGVAPVRAAVASGLDAIEVVTGWRTSTPLTRPQWLDLGRWVLGAGLAAELGLPVDTPAPVDIPVDLPAWSWRRLDVPSHPRGGVVRTLGETVVGQSWAEGGQALRTLAGALGAGGRLQPELGGPLGTWDCVSARGFGQVFGIRGQTWTFHGTGRLELLLADAFAGPAEARAAADEVGTSGIVPGRWQIAGDHAVRLSDLDASRVTMHGRKGRDYVLPAGQMGMGQILQAMAGQVWQWQLRDGELYLTGPLMGGTVEMRMKPSAA